MDVEKRLQDAMGLSIGESKVYLALLKRGKSTASEIARETGIHRTTAYDFLEHLIRRGLAASTIVSGISRFSACEPNKLLQIMSDKQDDVRRMVPLLQSLQLSSSEDIRVEVFKGKEGFKFHLNDVLDVGQDFFGMGIDESLFRKHFAHAMGHYFRKTRKLGIHEYNLTSERAVFRYRGRNIHYRRLPEKFFEPIPTAIYGDRVFLMIWEPMTSIRIINQQLADTYRKYHRLLWDMAEPF